MRYDEQPRPKADDGRWTWAKIAIVVITAAVIALLLMFDLEK
jgi:hypothetical protein